jgi:hypothetical protein
MDKIDELKDSYKLGRITQSGLILAAIDEMRLGEIDLIDLSTRLELPYTSLRNAILKLRKQGSIYIPTRKGKRSAN